MDHLTYGNCDTAYGRTHRMVIGNRRAIEYPYKQIVENKDNSLPKHFIKIVNMIGVPNATL